MAEVGCDLDCKKEIPTRVLGGLAGDSENQQRRSEHCCSDCCSGAAAMPTTHESGLPAALSDGLTSCSGLTPCMNRPSPAAAPPCDALEVPLLLHKRWGCRRCGGIQRKDLNTPTCQWWICGSPYFSWERLEDGSMGNVEGKCDGLMLFNAQSTSLFGGGLLRVKVTTHTVLRFLGCCSECHCKNEFQHFAQRCDVHGCLGIMIIMSITDTAGVGCLL